VYVSGAVPVYLCTLLHIQPHTHRLAADCMLTSLLGGAGDAGILAAINVRQAYPCVHPLHSVEQDGCVQ
jgi:hypothetical protein